MNGKVLMERDNGNVKLVYFGPNEPLTVIATDPEHDYEVSWITPERKQNGDQTDVLECYNHPFTDYWQSQRHVPYSDDVKIEDWD